MAIVEMKKITLVGMNQDRHRLLRLLQRMGCVQIIHHQEEELQKYLGGDRDHWEEAQRRVSRLDWTIDQLDRCAKAAKGSLFNTRPVADDEAVVSARAYRREGMGIVERVEQIERTRGELRAQRARLEASLKALSPWKELGIPLERVGGTKSARIELIQVPEKEFGEFCRQLDQMEVPGALEEISRGLDGVSAVVACHLSQEAALEEILRERGANKVHFKDLKYPPDMEMDRVNDQLARLDEVEKQLQSEMEKLAKSRDELKLLRDVEAMEMDRMQASGEFLGTQSAFLMSGWAPVDVMETLEQKISKITRHFALEFSDPLPEEKPPTLLHNNRFARPFESIVELYSLPDSRGLDPTFIMAPFFICFFGMMVSDAGYGIVMAIVAMLATWKIKPRGMVGQIARILIYGGIGTVFWGAMYGGWFGVEVEPLMFSPMGQPMQMMILCLGVGVVHIFVGMGVAAYMNFKRGKPLDALFDQGFWLLLIGGLILMLLSPNVGGVLAIVGAVGILLTAGRAKQGNIFSKLVSGLGALYNVTSYLSDILSYIRLFGMGLATGVIGLVINTVAGMVMTSPLGYVAGIAILVGGHAFNLAINALGAYVHACRLQYIEFFGKFYEGEGEAFAPLKAAPRYVDVDLDADKA